MLDTHTCTHTHTHMLDTHTCTHTHTDPSIHSVAVMNDCPCSRSLSLSLVLPLPFHLSSHTVSRCEITAAVTVNHLCTHFRNPIRHVSLTSLEMSWRQITQSKSCPFQIAASTHRRRTPAPW